MLWPMTITIFIRIYKKKIDLYLSILEFIVKHLCKNVIRQANRCGHYKT